jgi:hypothetical protein
MAVLPHKPVWHGTGPDRCSKGARSADLHKIIGKETDDFENCLLIFTGSANKNDKTKNNNKEKQESAHPL